jgi:PASTA domain/Bacterial Ig-like domain
MILRRLGDDPRPAAGRLASLRLLGACTTIAVVLLALFAGSSGASVSDYTGTLYLTKTGSAIGSGNWQLVTAAPSPVDNSTQNRVNFGVANTGYAAFAPGVSPGFLGNTALAASISVSSCTGWIVDGSGGMTFGAGTWTFGATVEDPLSLNGQAKLTGAMYVTNGSGSVVSTVVPPTDGASSLIRSSGAATTNVSISAAASSFSLSSTQHLCLMFWRHQTTAYISGGASTRLFKLDVNDGIAAITSFPAPDGFPSVSLAAAPADGSSIIAGQTVTLGATYTDPENEAGTVTMQVCPTSACSTQQATTTFNGVASGSNVTWSPSLPDGTWYWRASGTDTVGGQSWSATHSFTLDTTIPTAPALVSPNDAVTTNSLSLTATFSDPSVADTGKLEFQLCSDPLCTSVVTTSPLTSTLTNGSNGSWTISPAPSDGSYYWEARSHDTAGNVSPWSASRSVTFDRTPPTTTIDSGPAQPSTTPNATFTFHASESATLECNLDGAGWGTSCTSPTSYSALADGSHTLQIRGTDGVGNVGSAASYTWSIDTTVPSTPTQSGPADGALVNAIPALGGAFNDPTSGDTGVVNVRVCTLPASAGVTCSGLVQTGSSSTVVTGNTGTYTPSGLADGIYDWQVQGKDTAGNKSGWTATQSFTLDTTPPDTSIGPTEPPAHSNSTSASFDFSATESGSTFKCSLDGSAFATCTSPVSYSSLSEASHTFSVEATDPAGNTDASPATYTWTVDVTPPDTSIGPTEPPSVSTSSSATFDLSATEPSTFECSLDGSAWAGCTSPTTDSGLVEATHTFQVRATDLAGNVDASPASYTWSVDTSVPSATLVAPADGSATNTLPQFQGTFTDPNAADSGTVEFRICSAAASGGAACGPTVQDVVSSSVASGTTATYTPSSLANGLYYWQVRAQDAAGNQSAWTSTRSLIYDTNTPDVPVLQSPDNGVWLRSIKLTATFNEPSFAGTGSIEFRICSDAMCIGVGADGTSATVANGAPAAWEGPRLLDGYWWWQARAHDQAGNVSAWSAVHGFHLDATPPAAPLHFNGTMGSNGLTLRWDPPVDSIANFVVYVNGNSAVSLGGTTYEYNVGAFDAGDTRTFSVRAVDLAGNFGAMSTVLVGVPNLVGMTIGQAETAAQARGLVLRHATSSLRADSAVIVSQDPAAPAVAPQGSSVNVVLKRVPSAKTPFTVQVLPARVVCAGGSVLKVHLQLSLAAFVDVRVLGRGGRLLATRPLGRVLPGTAVESVRLPTARATAVVFLARTADGRIGRAVVHVGGTKHGCRAAH